MMKTIKPLLVAGATALLLLSAATLHATGSRTPQLASEVDRHEPLTPEQIQERYETTMQKCSVYTKEEREICEEEAKDKRDIKEENAALDKKDAEKREEDPDNLRKTAH